jgi:hypothetical protein
VLRRQGKSGQKKRIDSCYGFTRPLVACLGILLGVVGLGTWRCRRKGPEARFNKRRLFIGKKVNGITNQSVKGSHFWLMIITLSGE